MPNDSGSNPGPACRLAAHYRGCTGLSKDNGQCQHVSTISTPTHVQAIESNTHKSHSEQDADLHTHTHTHTHKSHTEQDADLYTHTPISLRAGRRSPHTHTHTTTHTHTHRQSPLI